MSVITAITTIWFFGSSTPSPAISELPLLATTSIASPIRKGGARSTALFRNDHMVAMTMRRRYWAA